MLKDTRQLFDEIVVATSMAEGRRLIVADRREAMLAALSEVKRRAKVWAAEPNKYRHWHEVVPRFLQDDIDLLEKQIGAE